MILANEENINRLIIYSFYDKDGIVDEYVLYYLQSLRQFVKKMIVIVNGDILPEGMSKLRNSCDHIIVRENEGYDITSYKVGLNMLSPSELKTFDEYILANSTLFGPIYPFSEMFNTMNGKDLDFWGITKHHKVDHDVFGTCKYGYIPEHIQSSFLVIRKSLFESQEYKQFWGSLPPIHSYQQAVGFFEVIFTKDFGEMGFKWDVYINTDDLEGYTRYPLMMMSDELVVKRRCPVIKQKSFTQNYYDILTDTVGNATLDTYEFIRSNTNYNVDMIWDNILRTQYLADIKTLMHLNYVLPQHYKLPSPIKKQPKIALMMHLYYKELVVSCLDYARSMPEGADLIITTPLTATYSFIQEQLKHFPFNKVQVILIENRGRDVSSLLVGCAPYVHNYDYVCFVHDKKTMQVKPYCNGKSFAYQCLENNLGSKHFVENIIATFESNPRLGMLMPPPPSHGNLYQTIGSEWASNYSNTLTLLKQLKINTPIHYSKEPISPLGTMFWFRPQALKLLFDQNWTYEDFPQEPNGFDGTLLHAIERAYGIIVQHEGYYPAWVMTDKFARIQLTNLHFMLREINLSLFKKYPSLSLLDMTTKMNHPFNLRHLLKEKVRENLPHSLWNVGRKIYRTMRPIHTGV